MPSPCASPRPRAGLLISVRLAWRVMLPAGQPAQQLGQHSSRRLASSGRCWRGTRGCRRVMALAFPELLQQGAGCLQPCCALPDWAAIAVGSCCLRHRACRGAAQPAPGPPGRAWAEALRKMGVSALPPRTLQSAEGAQIHAPSSARQRDWQHVPRLQPVQRPAAAHAAATADRRRSAWRRIGGAAATLLHATTACMPCMRGRQHLGP